MIAFADAEVMCGSRIDVQLRRDSGFLQRKVHQHTMYLSREDGTTVRLPNSQHMFPEKGLTFVKFHPFIEDDGVRYFLWKLRYPNKK